MHSLWKLCDTPNLNEMKLRMNFNYYRQCSGSIIYFLFNIFQIIFIFICEMQEIFFIFPYKL